MLKDFMTRPAGASLASLLWPGRATCAMPAPIGVERRALLETVS